MADAAVDLSSILYSWPYYSLAGALATSLILVLPSIAKAFGYSPSSRLLDLWKFWWIFPLYAVHQFEEHGIDALGERYAFQPMFCSLLGWKGPGDCPVTPAVIFAVNVGTVYTVALLSGLLGPKAPLVAILGAGIFPTNAITHVLNPLVTHRAYHPGLLTSCLLFFPASVAWYRAVKATRRDIGLSILAGFGAHVPLVLGFKALMAGRISERTCIIIQLLNGFYPLLGLLARKPAPKQHSL